MKKIIHLSSFLLIVLFCAQCKSKQNGAFTVTVEYKNADKMVTFDANGKANGIATPNSIRLLLEEIPYGNSNAPVILDSITLKENSGTVTLKGKGKEEGIYQLFAENGQVVLLVNDEDAMNVVIDLGKRDNYYTVSGSEGSKILKDFIAAYSEKSFCCKQIIRRNRQPQTIWCSG